MIRALFVCASLLLAAASARRAGSRWRADACRAGAPARRARGAQGMVFDVAATAAIAARAIKASGIACPPERQQALAKGSQRWLSMTPEQRSSAQQRFTQWRAMPPEQRQQLRQRWQQFKSLPPEQQQRVRESFNRFRQMPPERRQELRRQWRQMSPEQRRSVHPAAAAAGRSPADSARLASARRAHG